MKVDLGRLVAQVGLVLFLWYTLILIVPTISRADTVAVLGSVDEVAPIANKSGAKVVGCSPGFVIVASTQRGLAYKLYGHGATTVISANLMQSLQSFHPCRPAGHRT